MALKLDFQGKRVLVTAGTKGVGKAVVGLLKEWGQVLTTASRTHGMRCRCLRGGGSDHR
jgi:NADPH:quinone reductase-like Zn-dependent oxidoreductase